MLDAHLSRAGCSTRKCFLKASLLVNLPIDFWGYFCSTDHCNQAALAWNVPIWDQLTLQIQWKWKWVTVGICSHSTVILNMKMWDFFITPGFCSGWCGCEYWRYLRWFYCADVNRVILLSICCSKTAHELLQNPRKKFLNRFKRILRNHMEKKKNRIHKALFKYLVCNFGGGGSCCYGMASSKGQEVGPGLVVTCG